MRTAGHPGPGRPSRGRGSAAEGVRFASKRGPGPWGEDPPDCHNGVERYPERVPEKMGPLRLLPWALDTHGFLFAQKGALCGPRRFKWRENK